MDGKVVKHHCTYCDEEMEFDFNVDDYSSEIMIMNGQKFEKRTFIKPCPNCNEPNLYESDQKEDWGTRRNITIRKVMIGGMFSCLFMVILFCLVAYFAGKGIITVFDWLF